MHSACSIHNIQCNSQLALEHCRFKFSAWMTANDSGSNYRVGTKGTTYCRSFLYDTTFTRHGCDLIRGAWSVERMKKHRTYIARPIKSANKLRKTSRSLLYGWLCRHDWLRLSGLVRRSAGRVSGFSLFRDSRNTQYVAKQKRICLSFIFVVPIHPLSFTFRYIEH